MPKSTAVIISNLGTPNSYSVADVKKYLGEFLMDPDVININYFARLLLVKGIILNTRPKKTAALYKKIWTERGSPLMFHALDLRDKLQNELKDKVDVYLGMRYGSPNYEQVLSEVKQKNYAKILFLPLYPQYSTATTRSSILAFEKTKAKLNITIPHKSISEFYQNPDFIKNWADKLKDRLQKFNADAILFSYHGLPQNMLMQNDPSQSHCYKAKDCCNTVCPAQQQCYKAQCEATSRLIIAKANIDSGLCYTSFQSRLGRAKWIEPYTEDTVVRLAKEGKKRLLIISPAFVADCIETLEELNIQVRETFIENGGQDFYMLESLNSDAEWVKTCANLIEANI